MTNNLYLSPHLDDAILSCGGLIHDQIQAGDHVEVWTIFTGDPPGKVSPFAAMLHERWGTAQPYQARRLEDQKACASLGVSWVHFGFLDGIYRVLPGFGDPVIKTDAELFAEILPEEAYLIEDVKAAISEKLPKDVVIFSPLAVGGHVDHRIVKAAVEGMNRETVFFADFPYAASMDRQIDELLPRNVKSEDFVVSEAGLSAWVKGISHYHSQISSFWQSDIEMAENVRQYSALEVARTLWRRTL